MFVGMSKNFWGLLVCFFTNLKAASKKMRHISLFHTTACINNQHITAVWAELLTRKI